MVRALIIALFMVALVPGSAFASPDNRAVDATTGYGGGIYCQGGSPEISHNIIGWNEATNHGGGIYTRYDSQPIVVNNVILTNLAEVGAGISCDVASPYVTNNTIVNNKAHKYGGGMYGVFSDAVVANCIFWKNLSSSPSTGPQLYFSACNPSVTYCDVEGGWTGVGNIDAGPQSPKASVDMGADEYCILKRQGF